MLVVHFKTDRVFEFFMYSLVKEFLMTKDLKFE